MRIECPHCQNAIEVVLDTPLKTINCPQCGSTISLMDPEGTAFYPEDGAQLIGRFRLIDHLGSGSFGQVWKAHDSQLDREVALKLPRRESMSAADVERFVREARVAAQLNHPNVVRVHEVGQTDNLVFIVSEIIDGMNLAEWLAINKPTDKQAATLCATLADALQHAHDAGIVHRDLKPSNVLMDSQGNPHLTDFGLAKRDGAEITMTIAGRILGTPAYMSPEQARGDAHDADRRSDVYSLGVMLFEMLVGVRPFVGTSKMMLIQQVLHSDAPSPRRNNKRIPRDLDTICLKALEKAPEKRYQSAKEMGDDLRRFIDGKPILARRITSVERGWRWTRRNPMPASLAAIASVLLLAVATLTWRNATMGASPSVIGTREASVPESMRQREVSFTTNPPGAKVAFVPINRDTGEPIADDAVRPTDVTPLKTMLRPGRYLVVAVVEGHGFHEVYRTVPAPDETLKGRYRHNAWIERDGAVIELPPIDRIPSTAEAIKGMVYFPGGEFNAGDVKIPASPRFRVNVAPFYLGQTEVTVGDFKSARVNLSGTLTRSGVLLGELDPVTYVDYSRAIEYAELAGLRLPTQYEYESAATANGTKRFPWGDDETKIAAWPIGPIGTPEFDRTATIPPVFGLYSGVVEWTDSRQDLKSVTMPDGMPHALRDQIRNGRIIRGGPASVAHGKLDLRQRPFSAAYRAAFENEVLELSGLGFRCARSSRPRYDQ